MFKLILEVFLTISGISATSGLVYQNNSIYLISDNSDMLYRYNIPQQKLYKTPLSDRKTLEDLPKKEKSDFEAMTLVNDEAFIYSSGSEANRTHRYTVSKTTIHDENWANIYADLKKRLHIADKDFNIEGVVHFDDKIWLFNRGNGPKEQNGIIEYVPKDKTKSTFIPVKLPSLDGQPTNFSDAVLVDQMIYFVSSAENSSSTYLDGAIGGSMLGRFPVHNPKNIETLIIPGKHKFEGITLKEKTDYGYTFLLCEDNDDNSKDAVIYTLQVTN